MALELAVSETYTRRHRRRESSWHRVVFRMRGNRLTNAATRSPTRNSSTCEPTAITTPAQLYQGRGRQQTLPNFAYCGAKALFLDRLYDLLDLIWPFTGLCDQIIRAWVTFIFSVPILTNE